MAIKHESAKPSSSKRQTWRKRLIFTSFLLFPITIYYFSPALIIEATGRGIINGSFIAFGLMFIASLVLGRAWCGWACPGGGLGEACQALGAPKAPGGRLDWIKYFLWLPWLGLIIFMAIRAGGYKTIDPLFQTWHGISVHDTPSYIVYFFFVAVITTLGWLPGRRGFCHYVCWMAPFMIIGQLMGRAIPNRLLWPSLQLKAQPAACTKCATCADNCPMSLPVIEMVAKNDLTSSECILCGTCVDNCPQGAIKFSWRQ